MLLGLALASVQITGYALRDAERIAPPATPVPYSPPLEEFFLPNVQTVVEKARELAAY